MGLLCFLWGWLLIRSRFDLSGRTMSSSMNWEWVLNWIRSDLLQSCGCRSGDPEIGSPWTNSGAQLFPLQFRAFHVHICDVNFTNFDSESNVNGLPSQSRLKIGEKSIVIYFFFFWLYIFFFFPLYIGKKERTWYLLFFSSSSSSSCFSVLGGQVKGMRICCIGNHLSQSNSFCSHNLTLGIKLV